MRITMKIGVLLLVLLLAGCGEKTAETVATTIPTETTAQTSAPTETTVETIQAPSEPIVTQEALQAALETQPRVIMEGDIQLQTGVVVKKGLLDGAGFQLTAPVYNEEDPETYCAVFAPGGYVENVVIKGGYRGIGTGTNHRIYGDLRLNKVEAEGENCALYIGEGSGVHKVNVSNSTFHGRTVFNRIESAYFEDCTFTYNESGSRGELTAYVETALVNCRFEGSESKKFTLVFARNVEGKTMFLENCYVGDTLITMENVDRLLNLKLYSNSIQVQNG